MTQSEPVAPEPVAWGTFRKDGRLIETFDTQRKALQYIHGDEYVAPLVEQRTPAVALSDEQRDAARYRWMKMFSQPNEMRELLGTPWMKWNDYIDAKIALLARATEMGQA